MYDVLIVGAGPGGIFTAYELLEKRPELKIAVFEMGNELKKRRCPIDGDKVKSCIHCKNCSIMSGFGGAGAFSDGKYNFTTAFGGWLTDFMDDDEVMKLINYVDTVNMKYGATDKTFSTDTPEAKALEREALKYDLHLLQAKVKHLGTENNLRILQNMYDDLKNVIEYRFRTAVETIDRQGDGYTLTLKNGDIVDCKYLIAAPGRSGAEWFANQCKKLGVHLINNQVDVGVRVELPATVFEHITDVVYESKLIYRTKQYER